MKKFLVVLLACAMIFGFASTAMAADTQITEFNDIADQSVAARNAIMKLAVLGVIEGNEGIGGAYRPADNLTRAEFAKIVCYLTGNVKQAEALASVGSRFTDVTTGNWYTGWVNMAAQSGYFMGDPGGTFRPNANITMQEVVTVVLRAAGYTDKLGSSTGATTWPGNYISKALAVGVLDDVTFVGSAAATRSDMAIICEAVLGINMVVHINNEIAYALALSDGNVDPDGFSEVYYLTNETDKRNEVETILHKAFKGQYYDVQVNPALMQASRPTGATATVIDGDNYYSYGDYTFTGRAYDESFGWNYEDFASNELALNLVDSFVYDNIGSQNKKFEKRTGYYEGNNWVDSEYRGAEALAGTYYITREFDLTELAGMQVQVTVIDGKEIAFVDVVSSYVYADSVHLDRANNSTSTQNIAVDGKNYRPSATMDVKNKIDSIEDYSLGFGTNGTVTAKDNTEYPGLHRPIQYLYNSNNDDDFPGKVYLDREGRIYAVKNYDAYDATPFGIFDDIDSSRVNWKETYLSADDNLKIETNKNYTLYKDGEAIKAEDLTENDLVSYLGRHTGANFYLATAPVEGELTAHNKYNNRLTLGGTAYRTINASGFKYSDDGGETFGGINLNTYEVDFGEAEFAKAYNFSKAAYVSGNLSNQKVIGVITKVEPTQIWSSNARQERVEEITIYNAEGKEVKYTFTKDFRNGYNRHVNITDAYPGITLVTDATTDKEWNAATNNKSKYVEALSGRLYKGDIVQLVLDKDDKVKRIDNYAHYAIDSFDVRVTASNNRVILKGGTFTLNKDAVVFNVTSDEKGAYDDVSIQSVSSVLAKDFRAAKAVAFDVKTGANVNALYIIGDISVYQFGILTGNGRDSGGDYYTINGQKVYASSSAIPTRWTVVSYIMSGGEATLTPITGINNAILADKTGVVTGLKDLVDALGKDNTNAVTGPAESYRTGTKALQIGTNSYVYITDNTYIYDLLDEKVVDAADLIATTRKTVVAFYDRDGNAEFVAVVGSGAISPSLSGDASVTSIFEKSPSFVLDNADGVYKAKYTSSTNDNSIHVPNNKSQLTEDDIKLPTGASIVFYTDGTFGTPTAPNLPRPLSNASAPTTNILFFIVTAANGTQRAYELDIIVDDVVIPAVTTVTVSGDAIVGKTLTAKAYDASGTELTANVSYQWQRQNANGLYTNIGTGATYVVQAAEKDLKLRVLATGTTPVTGSAYSTLTATVTEQAALAGTVTISGTVAVGQTLTANASVTSTNPGTLSYHWLRDGVAISGATNQTYTLTAAEASHTISVMVSAANYGGAVYSVASAVPAVPTLAGAVTISGTATFGQTLGVNTSGITSTNPGALSYQWKRGSTNIGTNSQSYTLVAADVGQVISVDVSAANYSGVLTASAGTVAALTFTVTASADLQAVAAAGGTGSVDINLSSLVTGYAGITGATITVATADAAKIAGDITYAGTTISVADDYSAGADVVIVFDVKAPGYTDATITITVKSV